MYLYLVICVCMLTHLENVFYLFVFVCQHFWLNFEAKINYYHVLQITLIHTHTHTLANTSH